MNRQTAMLIQALTGMGQVPVSQAGQLPANEVTRMQAIRSLFGGGPTIGQFPVNEINQLTPQQQMMLKPQSSMGQLPLSQIQQLQGQ